MLSAKKREIVNFLQNEVVAVLMDKNSESIIITTCIDGEEIHIVFKPEFIGNVEEKTLCSTGKAKLYKDLTKALKSMKK